VQLAAGLPNHRLCPVVASDGKGATFVIWLGKTPGVQPGDGCGSLFVRDGKTEKQVFKIGGGRQGLAWADYMPHALVAGSKGYFWFWPGGRTGHGGGQKGVNAVTFDAEGNPGKPLLLADGLARYPDAVWDGSAYVAAWHDNPQSGKQPPCDAVFTVRVSESGEMIGQPQVVSGTFESPARAAALASDGAGTSLIAYEKHPEKADVPIKIGFRMLTAK